jgi:hypothetical protein
MGLFGCGFGKELISGVCMNALKKSIINKISMCGFGCGKGKYNNMFTM